MGIEAIFLSGETKTSENVERAIRGEYQLIIACPETLESPTFASILHSPVVRSKLMSINVDEAHCVYEMSSWRGAYKRLDRLRSSIASIGRKIPILATSATLPCHHVSLIRDVFDVEDKYTFINLGNHRPELSTVILEMQHTASSCRDLKFLLPTTLDPKNIPPTIIYSNDIDLLYKVLDNFETWLIELGFTQNRLVDIYHAGLTKYHKNWCLNDVHAGNTRILLATEAIGMGVNLPGIRRVVQFRCAGLSYSQLVQRFGRAGRDVGGSGIGYLIIEKRMLDRTKVSVKMPKTEDPGLLQLIQSPDICCAVVADLYFENPVRPEPSPKCCSRCNPNLLPPRTYDFVLVSGCTKPITDAPQKNPDETAEDRIFVYLSIWRDEQWEKEWKAKCPSLTKSSLISNGDLQSIAQHAGKICDIEQLLDHTRIVQDVLVGNQLYCAFQEAWELEYPGLPLPRKLTDDEVAEQSLAPIVPPAPLTHALAVAPPAQPPKRPRSATIQRTTTSNLPKRARIQEK